MPENTESATATPKKILVVDDSQVIAKTLPLRLNRAGYKTCVALEASEAVNLIRTEKPDLIVLDIHFPPDIDGMTWDGFRVIEWLRRGESQTIPVIIITGGPGEPDKDKQRALAAGAVGFLHKPLDHEELLRMIRATLDVAKT